jgi:MFS family permease
MALGCVYVHQISPTKPPGSGFPLQGVIDTLGNTNFLIFVLVSMVIAGLMQFYFLGSAQFMQDAGISSKAVPGAMALAQIAQALATYFLLGWVLVNLGFKWPLIIGASCWFVLYLAYIAGRPQWLIVVSQPLHGFAYVFFMIVGQVVTNEVSADEIISSMQALIFAATTGVGLFAGTNFAGAVMDSSSRDGKFQWPKIWAVPALVTLTGVVVLLFAFSEPPKKADPPAKPAVSWNTPGR